MFAHMPFVVANQNQRKLRIDGVSNQKKRYLDVVLYCKKCTTPETNSNEVTLSLLPYLMIKDKIMMYFYTNTFHIQYSPSIKIY